MNYGTIVICGGGCYGGYYVRQLARARAAGALRYDRLLVVDHDDTCRAARLTRAIHERDVAAIRANGWRIQRDTSGEDDTSDESAYDDLPVSFVHEAWLDFLSHWFVDRMPVQSPDRRDAVVPSPLMPNLLADWVTQRMLAHQPGATVHRVSVSAAPETPWSRTGSDGSHYASFATWMCPINCIEPARCPETRGPRDWSMPVSVQQAADGARARGAPFDVIAQFRTTHRAFGVGMFDVSDAAAAEDAIRRAAPSTAVRALVASVSHCHGAMAELVTTPRTEPIGVSADS